MNMEGWVLLGADRQEVPVTVYSGQDLVEADLSDVPDVYQDLHWHAPRTYLGDKVRHRRRRRGGAGKHQVLVPVWLPALRGSRGYGGTLGGEEPVIFTVTFSSVTRLRCRPTEAT